MPKTLSERLAETYAREGAGGILSAGFRRVVLEPFWRQ